MLSLLLAILPVAVQEPAPAEPPAADSPSEEKAPATLEELLAEFERMKKELDDIEPQKRVVDDFLDCENQLQEIGRLDSDVAVVVLLRLAEEGGWSGRLLDATARGLMLNSSTLARETLMEWIEEKKLDNHRRAAAQALVELGSETDLEWLRDKRLRAEKNGAIQGIILDGLLDRQVEGLDSIVLKAAKEKDARYVAAGIRGIGLLKLKKGMKTVEKNLGDPSIEVRKRCFEALASLGGDDAYRLLLDAYHDARNEGLRTDIAVQLQLADEKDEIAVLIKDGIGDRDPDVVKAAVDAIAFAAEHEPDMCGPVLLDMLGDSDEEIRTSAIEGMVRARPEGAIQALIKRLDHDDYRTRTDATWALAQLGDLPPEAEAKFIELTVDDRPAVRLHAVDALTWFVPSEDAYQAAIPRLQDELWSVRSQAIRTMEAFQRVDSLPHLVKVVQKDRGRVKDDALAALARLSGEDFGPLEHAWAKWLGDLPADYALPTPEQVEEMKAARKRAREGDGADTKSKSTYHGISVPRGGVVFILDISGSMDQEFDEDQTFFEHFSEALIETISNLKNDTDFNIVTFSSGARPWLEERLLPADEENTTAGVEYLREMRPGGATNLFEALQVAFSFQETQTIFLLTDGDPTMGLTVPDVILDEIQYMNRDRRIQIHTIAAGDVKAEFLADLAASNGGEAVDLTHLGGKKSDNKKKKP